MSSTWEYQSKALSRKNVNVLFHFVAHHLVNDLSYGVHHDRPQSDEDLPRVVEEDDVLGGGDVGDVDVAGHQADGGSREKSGQDETGDLSGG